MSHAPAVSLPEAVQARLDRLVAELNPKTPKVLSALALYGGVAKGKPLTPTSDLNLLVVPASADPAALAGLAEPLARARRDARAVVLVATKDELAAMAGAFPLKYQDIRRHHVLLLGADPFGGKEPSAADLRADAGRNLLNLSLRLNRAFVERGGDRALLLAALEDMLGGAVLSFQAALDPAGVSKVRRREDVLAEAAKASGADAAGLLALLALKKGGDASGADPAALGAALLAASEGLRRKLEAA
jgi:hypothetical protein